MRCMTSDYLLSLSGQYAVRIEAMLHDRLEQAFQAARSEQEPVLKSELYSEAAMYADMLVCFAEAEECEEVSDES